MKNARWLALIAAAMSIGLLLSLLLQNGEVTDPGQAAPRSTAGAPRHPSAVPSGKTAAPMPPNAAINFDEMRDRFHSAASYAAFIQDAMQRPDQGGRFYAFVAYQRCREVAALPATPQYQGVPAAIAAAQEAVAGLQRRCHGVLEQFPSEAVLQAALLHSNARSPDALLIERGSLKPVTRETSGSDIARAFATRDPYLIAGTLDANLDFIADRLGPEFAHGQEQALLYQAMAAASCEIIGDCEGNYRLALACASGEACSQTNFAAYVRQGVPAESKALYDRTAARIVGIARARALALPE